MTFKIRIEQEALADIQQAVTWYNEQQAGLGHKFHDEVKASFKKLKINPFFQIRYDNVRCLPLRKFPYMIHFTIHEQDKLLIIWAIFNTGRNPDIWKKRK